MIGGIEAGGTKFICAVADENLNVIKKVSVPTTNPEETMNKVFSFFDEFQLESIGLGAFGPIDVNKNSETYGFIRETPKTSWKNFNIVGAIKERYNIPVEFSTDVNVAALGELTFGSARGKQSCLYLTIGTGVGGGAIVFNKTLEGFGHPEMGHILIRKQSTDLFEGICPYHGDCLEGLVSGPAIAKRAGKLASELSEDDAVWDLVADYVGQALVDYTLTLSPEIIVLGGGVMNQRHLLPMIREKFKNYLNNYIETPSLDEYIVGPELAGNSGIMGSLELGKLD